jgi:hypothetical protein
VLHTAYRDHIWAFPLIGKRRKPKGQKRPPRRTAYNI